MKINYFFLLTFVLAISFSFYKYYYTADFNYRIEAACDPLQEKCYYRPCDTNPDECLPNGLSYYKIYYIKAYDFPKCADNSCKAECETGKIKCDPLPCDEDNCTVL